jgi:hypothetical protein
MKETNIQKVVNKNKLSISRIPSWAKEFIIEKAESEHCGDYGACVAHHIRNSMEYDALKNRLFSGDLNMKLIENDEVEKPVEKEIKTGNGKVIKRREN